MYKTGGNSVTILPTKKRRYNLTRIDSLGVRDAMLMHGLKNPPQFATVQSVESRTGRKMPGKSLQCNYLVKFLHL